ncbi:LamG-like jellyroll fold domain-containing protein [Streptomyces sp. NBC_00391]|uniref:LamG-like jellyroll fold domain-containing protein n=1 Tax=Streptomyces sp. NBC_00391 TaxID=2903647 RepID=UPI002E1C2FA3
MRPTSRNRAVRGAMTVASAVLVLAGGIQAAPVQAAGMDTGGSGTPADEGARGKEFWEDDALPAATPEQRASEKAVASGKSVEIGELTSSTSRVVANPDGTFTAETAASPERVLKAGEWTDVDTTLVARPDGGLAPRAAEDIRFSSGGTGEPLARMVTAGKEYAVSSPWALPKPEVDGSSAVYRSVLPEVDLAVQAHPDGFTYHLVVHSREAAANPALKKVSFPVEAHGLSVRMDDSGAATFVDGSGHAVISSGSALMWDAGTTTAKAGSAARSASTVSAFAAETAADTLGASPRSRTAVMDTDVTNDALSIVPDQDFLASGATSYPVVLDPPAVKATLTGWTALWSNSPGTSLWKTKHALGVGYDAFVDNKKSRSLFQFDTRRVAGKKIVNATFTPYAIWSANCVKHDVDLYRTSQIFSSTTWNKPPKWLAKVDTVSAAKGHSSDCPDGDIEFDATAAVAHTAKAKDTLTTLGLRADEDDPIAWKQFLSPLDPDATSSRKPRLSITYVTPPNSKPSSVKMSDPKVSCSASSAPAQIRDTTPRLTATPTSSDASNASLRPNFELYKGSSTTETSLKPSTWTDSGTAGTVVTAALDQAVTYKFRARTEYKYTWQGDTHSLFGPWSSYCHFRVDSKGPPVPKVSSTVYKECGGTVCEAADPELGSVGMTAGFKIDAGASDVRRYDWWLNGAKLGSKTFTANTSTYGIEAAPDKRLTNTLRVQTYDGAGNPSAHYDYLFKVAKGSDPVASWNLDDGSGATAADGSGKNRPLALTSASWTDKARLGGGLRANGTSSAGSSTSVLDTTNSFTVSAWARLTAKDHISTVVSQSGSRVGTFQIYYSQTYDRWIFNRYSADNDDPTIVRAVAKKPPVVGAWTHLMGVYDHNKKQIRLYVNGQLQAATEFTTPWAAKGSFEVGRMKGSGTYTDYFEGDLDQVQVWDRVVFENEMWSIANTLNPATGRTEPALLANWGFDEASGATAADATGRGNPLQLQTGAAFAATENPAHGNVLELDAEKLGRATSTVSLDESGSFSLAGWVNLAAQSKLDDTTVAHSPSVFSHPGAERNSLRLWYRQEAGQVIGDWNFGRYETDVLGGPAVAAVSDEVNSPGGWVHVVAVFDSVNKSIHLYVSGQRQGDEDGVLSEEAFQPTGPLMVGGARRHDNGEWGNALPGQLDDLRVYAGVLSDDEITQLATVDEPPVPVE